MFRPPTRELYDKTRGYVLGLGKSGEITEDEMEEHLEMLPVPRPDQTRPCRAYVGHGLAMKQWIALQSQIVKRLSIGTYPSSEQDAKVRSHTLILILEGCAVAS